MSKEMKTLTINGNLFEIVDEYAREHGGSGNSTDNSSEIIKRKYEFYPITFADVFNAGTSGYVPIEYSLGYQIQSLDINQAYKLDSNSNYYVGIIEVNKGDSVVMTNAFEFYNFNTFCVYDENLILQQVFYYQTFGNNTEIEIKYNGTLVFGVNTENVSVGEFCYIKRPAAISPFVLYEEKTEEYLTDTAVGDAVIDAIMSNRTIHVRVPNSDGNKYTAIYSPIMMYQLPNYMNDYIYLFYLKDEKQNLDLSALGMGTIQLPIYGQLKIKVSRTYNATPLT